MLLSLLKSLLKLSTLSSTLNSKEAASLDHFGCGLAVCPLLQAGYRVVIKPLSGFFGVRKSPASRQ